MSRSRLLVALFAVLLLAAACGGSDSGSSDSSASGGEAAAAEGGEAAEPINIVLPTSSGGQLDFGDLEGQPALLWFWAPW